MSTTRLLTALTAAGLLAGGLAAGGSVALADSPAPKANAGQARTVALTAQLTALNDSGVSGTASATVRNQLIRQVDIEAHGLAPDAPHAVHIHYGDDARNECPTMADATNERIEDGHPTPRLSTADGLPAYGPIVVSLTTSGDTTPDSALALDRYPVSAGGTLSYSRRNIEFTDVSGTGYTGGTGTAKQIADSIREGEGVLVIHGVDYNDNDGYDFDGAGRSELTPMPPFAPAEATDPTACGVLR